MLDLVLVLSSVFFDGERFRVGELHEDSSSSAGVTMSSGTMGPFPLSRAISCTSRPLLMHLCDFFRSGLAAGHSRAITTRLDLATLSSVLLVPLTFSLYLSSDWFIRTLVIALASGEIDVEWGISRSSGDEWILDSH